MCDKGEWLVMKVIWCVKVILCGHGTSKKKKIVGLHPRFERLIVEGISKKKKIG
jgi:hypothetical protein